MLVNLLRILGAVKAKKAGRHFVTWPTSHFASFTQSWTFCKRWSLLGIEDLTGDSFQLLEP